MRPALAAIAARQSGLFTRRQCVHTGYSEVELRALTAVHGPWVVVRRGVYADRALWESATGYDDRARLRDRAVHLSAWTPHVLSHDSAARALGVPLLRPLRELSHLTRPGVCGTRTERGVKHHLTRFTLPGAVEVAAMTVTGLARTCVDLAREHGLSAGVVAADHALGRGVTRRELESELAVMRSWPGVRTAREAVDRAATGAESPGESLTRLLVEDLGLGPVETQFPVLADGRLYWADLRVGRHLIEFDGHTKLIPVERGGVASRPPEEVLRAERSRQIQMCGAGFGMSRVEWHELFGRAREATTRRILREYAVTHQRFGAELSPYLAQSAERLRRTRSRSA